MTLEITVGIEEMNELMELISVALMDKSSITYKEARETAERVVALWLQGQLGSKQTG